MLVSGAHEVNGPLDPGGPARRPTYFKDHNITLYIIMKLSNL